MATSREPASVVALAMVVALSMLAVGLFAMWLITARASHPLQPAERAAALRAAQSGLARAREVLAGAAAWQRAASGRSCSGARPSAHGRVLCEAGRPLQDVPLSGAGSAPGQRPSFSVFVRGSESAKRARGPRLTLRIVGRAGRGSSSLVLRAVVRREITSLETNGWTGNGGTAPGSGVWLER